MNNGKICVSVCAETADDLIEQIKRAENLADVIEIRFDCLTKNEFNLPDLESSQRVLDKILSKQNIKKEIILTFRPKEQGGKREISQEEREIFWNSGFDRDWADLEEDVLEDSYSWLWEKRICSYHDFTEVPDNLSEIYQRIKSRVLVDVIKIAVQANEITETIEIWKLLEKAKSENRQIIPIAMGEAGKWTRILGLANGAFMTYAALDAGRETAPGQISAQNLIEIYRVKELDENTEVYGIVGGDTSYSMSPPMHNAAFKFHNLNAVFIPLQVGDLHEFMRRMVKPATREIELNFKGFAVTMPHKQAIIAHLDSIDETAQAIGAVNTVKIENGKFYGFNTDARGFIEPLLDSYGDLKDARVAIFGAGGAARACVYALKKEGANVTIFARDVKKAECLADDFQVELKELSNPENRNPEADFNNFDILVNSTPLGRTGNFVDKTPFFAEQIENVKLVYDLNYNPFQTKLMDEADKAGVPKIGGLAMLVAQAMAQQKIWTGKNAPMREMSRAALKKLQ